MKKQFYNFLPLDNDTCQILLYGYIGMYNDELSSGGFVDDLFRAELQYKNINIRVNSGGGDVFEGIAIFNALRQSKANISIYIDGVSASMAALISFAGKRLEMSRFGRIMLHQVSGSVFGNTFEVEEAVAQMKSLEETLGKIIAERASMTLEDVKGKYFDGKDHWLTAEEALSLGMIDAIYDGPEVKAPEKATTNELFQIFQNKLNLNDFSMKNLLIRLGLKNEATEDEAISKVAILESEKLAAEKKAADLENENKTLKDKLAAIETAEKQKAEAEDTAAVENAIKEGRIQASQKHLYINLFKSDRANTSKLLIETKPSKRLMDEFKGSKGEDRSTWGWDQWSQNDPKGLESMKQSNVDSFKALFKAKFNQEPKL